MTWSAGNTGSCGRPGAQRRARQHTLQPEGKLLYTDSTVRTEGADKCNLGRLQSSGRSLKARQTYA